MKKLIFSIIALATLTVSAETRSSKTDISRGIDIFSALFREVQLNYVDTLDAKKAIDKAIGYMLNEIDPYTEYYSSNDTEDLVLLSTGE